MIYSKKIWGDIIIVMINNNEIMQSILVENLSNLMNKLYSLSFMRFVWVKKIKNLRVGLL